jgi:hypothetical protein
MNFFEQELRRLSDAGLGIAEPTFAGRACFGDLGADMRVKLQFSTIAVYHKYEALTVAILNRTGGLVDSLLFHFSDVWGKMPVDNPYYRDGIDPYIWVNDGKAGWYIYEPDSADLRRLAVEVKGYLDVFADHSYSLDKKQQKAKQSVMEKLHEAKNNPTPQKGTPVKKRGQEL